MGLPCSLSQFISICYYHFEHLFLLNQITLKVKGSGPCRFGFKKKLNLYCFICNYYVALISALVLLKCGNLRITVVV